MIMVCVEGGLLVDLRGARGIAPTLACGLLLSGLGVVGAPAASADPCRIATTLVLDPPKRSFELPGGATARVWDTGKLKQRMLEARFVAVTIPKGTLIPRAETAPTLSDKSTPQAQAQPDPNAVVVINGAVFDPSGAATPRRSQITDGAVRKGNSVVDQGLALYEDTRAAAYAQHNLTGTFTAGLASIPIGAWNWQTLSGNGVTVYTHEWGPSKHTTGRRTLVVKDGHVTKVLLHKNPANKRPPKRTYYVTAPDGSAAASGLRQIPVGTPASFDTAETGTLPFESGKPGLGTPDSLIGVSSAMVKRGMNYAICDPRDNNLRPRSAIAWNADGDLIVATISGRAHRSGVRSGGASVYQWAEYLLHLGAVNAINLDGGSSTSLLVRREVGGPLRRLDRSQKDAQAKVADTLTFVAPTPGEPSVIVNSGSPSGEPATVQPARSSGKAPADSGK
jgi:hypothetical protein